MIKISSATWLAPFWHERNDCGNDSYGFHYDDCVTVLDGCGEFPANTTNVTVIGTNFDGGCLVARIGSGSATLASCQASHLTIDSNATCDPSFATIKPDQRYGVFILLLHVHVTLHILTCIETPSILCINREFHGVLFWWSAFWAGLFWNLVATLLYTTGIIDPVRSFIVSLVWGVIFVGGLHNFPLKLIKERRFTLCWIGAVSILGFFYLLYGIHLAYRADVVALVGNHAFLYGIAQWIAIVLEAVVKKHVCDCVRQRPQNEQYRLLITELAEPLPEVPRREDESQEDPGRV